MPDALWRCPLATNYQCLRSQTAQKLRICFKRETSVGRQWTRIRQDYLITLFVDHAASATPAVDVTASVTAFTRRKSRRWRIWLLKAARDSKSNGRGRRTCTSFDAHTCLLTPVARPCNTAGIVPARNSTKWLNLVWSYCTKKTRWHFIQVLQFWNPRVSVPRQSAQF